MTDSAQRIQNNMTYYVSRQTILQSQIDTADTQIKDEGEKKDMLCLPDTMYNLQQDICEKTRITFCK